MDLSFSVGIKIVFMVIVAPIKLVVSTQSLDTGNRHAMLRARANMRFASAAHTGKKDVG
jgi:hypothetical protein